MKANHPLPVGQLVTHFTRRRFSNEMRIAVNGSELGLKALLIKFPSIFTINGNYVGLTDWQGDESKMPQDSSDSEASSKSGKKNTFIPNVSAEMEAVRFFQDKFVKRSSREMQVRSLAGHLSQASSSIRRVVGPQLQFKMWLKKHPHIFEVEGDIVKLQDDVAALILDVEMAESELICNNGLASGNAKSKAEIMAIVFLGDLIRQHQGLSVDNIEDHIRLAPTTVRNFINFNNIKQFVSDNSAFFSIEEGFLKEMKSPCSNLVRTNELDKVELTEEEMRAGAIVGKGRIYHIAKLWGIIDLGQHDHVFFDRSILPKATLDMKKEFKVGQILSFKALPAPKTSRAKWKALMVWKPSFIAHSEQTEKEEESLKVEEEIYRLVLADHQMVDDLLNSDEEGDWINELANDSNNSASSSVQPSPSVVRKASANNNYLTNCADINGNVEAHTHVMQVNSHTASPKTVTFVNKDNRHFETSPFLNTNIKNGLSHNNFNNNKNFNNNNNNNNNNIINCNSHAILCTVSCQTESTGDIIATQLYNG